MTPAADVAWWGSLVAITLLVVGAQAWRDWRRTRRPARVIAAAAVTTAAAAAAAALLTPWRGEHDLPGAGRLLGAALVFAGLAWWRSRPIREGRRPRQTGP